MKTFFSQRILLSLGIGFVLIACIVGTALYRSYVELNRSDPFASAPSSPDAIFDRPVLKGPDGTEQLGPAIDEYMITYPDGTKKFVKRDDAEMVKKQVQDMLEKKNKRDQD